MPKVYIPNRSAHDFTPAEKFGTLVYLTEGDIPKYVVNSMSRKVAEKIRYSTPDDYLLITSLSVINAIVAGYLAHMHGRLNLLIWDAKDNKYESRTIVFQNLLPNEKELRDMQGRKW